MAHDLRIDGSPRRMNREVHHLQEDAGQ
jgi:hypothetical protein